MIGAWNAAGTAMIVVAIAIFFCLVMAAMYLGISGRAFTVYGAVAAALAVVGAFLAGWTT